MAKRLTAEQANALLASADSRDRAKALKALPPGVDVELVAKVVGDQLGDARSVWSVARHSKKLAAPIVRALVERLASVPGPSAIFLRVYLSGADDLALAWEQAMFRLLSLDTTYAWGSKQKRAKLEALAAEPKVIEALHAAVVSTQLMRMDWLAVLAIDASEASVDALMPHFERAAQDKGRSLDLLLELKRFASPTPSMTQLVARVDALVEERNSSSPALDFAARRGFGALKHFWFDLFLASDVQNVNGVPQSQGRLHIDSRQPSWFWCQVSRVDPEVRDFLGTRFGGRGEPIDLLKLGTCEADEVPQWLKAAGDKLRCTWDLEYGRPRTSLRGRKRLQMLNWLQTGT